MSTEHNLNYHAERFANSARVFESLTSGVSTKQAG